MTIARHDQSAQAYYTFQYYNQGNFVFAHNNVSEIYFTNGSQIYPQQPFRPDYSDDGEWVREFQSVYGMSAGVPMKSDYGKEGNKKMIWSEYKQK